MREIGGAIRGQTEVLGRFRAELEDRLRWERVSLGKAHSEAARGIESKAGEFYRAGLEGSEKRAREAARMDGFSLRYRHRDVDWYRLKRSVSEERMEQVREIDGEQAYEKMMRTVESGEILAASGAQEAGTKWTETRRTGAGLWPQPLRRAGCPRKNADPMQQEDWPNQFDWMVSTRPLGRA